MPSTLANLLKHNALLQADAFIVRNRMLEWRATPGQTLFHAAAWLVLIVVMLGFALRTAGHLLRARVDSGRCSVVLATHALDIVERYADRAVLLYEGRLLRGWNADDLARLRAMPGDGLEAELALAMQAGV